jgi:hypothetical protein
MNFTVNPDNLDQDQDIEDVFFAGLIIGGLDGEVEMSAALTADPVLYS